MILMTKQAKELSLMVSGARARYGEGSPELAQAKQALRELMRNNLNWWINTQSEWRVRCSRRIARNNHHDSWAIRETYARCAGSWVKYYDPSHRAIWQARRQKAGA